MARARNIKPSIMANDELAALPALTRLLFVYMWMLADKAGRLDDKPNKIGAQALPYDRTCDPEAMLQSLHECGFISRYVIGNKRYIQILSFTKHQNPHSREVESEIPAEEQAATGQDTTEAATKHDLGSDNASPSTDLAGLIPDSLIPDSRERDSSPAKPPTIPCPYQSIVDLYHQRLPELPSVKLMNDGRQTAMRKFWGWVLSSKKSDGTSRAESAGQALEWIGAYFERATSNDFLMGRGDRTGKHQGWRADFDFLLTDKGKKHVIEKTEDEAAA